MAEPAKEAKGAVGTAVETAKSTASDLSHKVSETVEKGVEVLLSRGLEGVKSIVHNVEEKKSHISSTIAEAATSLTHYSGSADSAPASKEAVSSRDLPQSTDSQPLVESTERAVQTTSWWQNCCGVLDVIKGSGR